MPYRVRAVLSTRLGEVAADIIDLSVGGLGVEVSGELRNHDFVRVLLPLAPGEEWIDPDALVARVHGKTSSGRIRLGLSFFQLRPDTLRRIAACVANHLETAAAPVPLAAAAQGRPSPSATTPAPASTATTRQVPKATPVPTKGQSATPPPKPASKPKPSVAAKPASTAASKQSPTPLHIPRASARELRDLFHEALASLEEKTGEKKKSR